MHAHAKAAGLTGLLCTNAYGNTTTPLFLPTQVFIGTQSPLSHLRLTCFNGCMFRAKLPSSHKERPLYAYVHQTDLNHRAPVDRVMGEPA
jgi:hypothetical protein